MITTITSHLPSEILAKAYSSGWQPSPRIKKLLTDTVFIPWEMAAGDPLFWQALARAYGWPGVVTLENKRGHVAISGWAHAMVTFWEIIAEEEHPQPFWTNIINNDGKLWSE